MTDRKRFAQQLAVLAAMLLGLPVIGAWAAGLPIAVFFEFPPQTRHVRHAAFSWAVFGGIAGVTALLLIPPAITAARAYRRCPPRARAARLAFPWWGWAGLALGAAAWVLAWMRFPWFSGLQPHTFSFLWLAYIAVVNALCRWRTGGCMLTDRTRFFAALFPASAAFWWFFEYLNRFVQNWYYVGPALSRFEYFVYATLPFATVLPAVLATRELLQSTAWVQQSFGCMTPLRLPGGRLLPWAALTASAFGLAGIGVWPDTLFPLLWVSPLIILAALRSLRRQPHILQDFTRSDWTGAASAALAALICGVFWEMWNGGSLSHWKYSIPYVQRFHLFEMPILGYAGYLPFGLECALVGRLVEEAL
jgi:hypothetical protein